MACIFFRPNQVVLEIRQRVPDKLTYSEPIELIWDTSRGASAQSLKQAIASVLFIDIENIVIAKHFPQRFEWLVIEKTEKVSHSSLTLSQTTPGFYVSAVQVILKYTFGKGEIAHNEQFLLFAQYFRPILRTSCCFIKFEIVVCKFFQFGRVLTFSQTNPGFYVSAVQVI